MSENQGYNGWTNYETWNVALWLGNDSDEYMQELTYNAYQEAEADRFFTRAERATLDLSDTLKDYVEEMNPLADQASMFSDLLGAAISSVNWHEIAEHYIEDLDKSEFEDETEETEAE